jgi:hypothetical protein
MKSWSMIGVIATNEHSGRHNQLCQKKPIRAPASEQLREINQLFDKWIVFIQE